MLLALLPNKDFCPFIVIRSWALSSLALMGTGSAKAPSSWSFNVHAAVQTDPSWLILTSLDSRRLRVMLRDIERETNVGQHWRFSLDIYSALFPELRAAGILWEKQDPRDWNKSVFLQPNAMCPSIHSLHVLVDPTSAAQRFNATLLSEKFAKTTTLYAVNEPQNQASGLWN